MRRIIIVDDDDLVRTSAALYFEDGGWVVDVAATAEQALACARTPFDVMLCDLHLSPAKRAEGLPVLAAARAAAPAAVLVLLSGEGPAELDESVRLDAVLQKPFRLSHLVGLLDRALQSRAGS